ncbi:MAG: serine/threonine protein kinase [Candidatus Eremiobacteraeota bacterium]|nr:serine/threonine protein kinase [Candidatus Eremiobacteraeota bacterium]
MENLTGQTLGQRYTVQRLVGQGGTADTYLARDLLLRRDVALKVLTDRSHDVRRRFMREAQAMAHLNHPSIVSVYDVGESDGWSYIVMEYVNGKTLRELEAGSLSYQTAIQYMIQVLGALEYAHNNGIIHRDVKPANVISVESEERVKLMDFGLSRRTSDMTQTTKTGQIVGTIAYLPPERFLSRPADPRGDLYSAGIVMYELFTGNVPFRNDSEDLVATIFSHVHDTPPSPRQVNRNVPAALERIIMKAIEKDPQKRFQTATEFMNELKRLIGQAVSAAPQAAATPAAVVSEVGMAGAAATKLPKSSPDRPHSIPHPELRTALDRALGPTRNRNDAFSNVLSGMLATRRRRYDEAKRNYEDALHDLDTMGNHLEYAKTALKFGVMVLQKAGDGMREREELRKAVQLLQRAQEIFREQQLVDQIGESEYLINSLERTAVGQ